MMGCMVSGPDIDHCLLEQYNKQVNDFEMELLDVSRSIATIDDAKELPSEKSQISDTVLNMGLKTSKLLSSATEAPAMPVREGIRLPKISVPIFGEHIIQWQLFWEQFEQYIHSRTEFSDEVKLAYLRDVLKDGLALNIVEGLAQMADNYSEAVSSP